MRLVYQESQAPVMVGDAASIGQGRPVTVKSFKEPHKPSSSGLVELELADPVSGKFATVETYVGVIGAVWIEREDQREYGYV